MTLGDIIAQLEQRRDLDGRRPGRQRAARVVLPEFGYGAPTGVGFPGEAAGLMPPAGELDAITRATVSFGAGRRGDAAADGGGVRDDRERRPSRSSRGSCAHGAAPDGSVTPRAGTADASRASPQTTADKLTRMLAYAVDDGTGDARADPGLLGRRQDGNREEARRAAATTTDRYVASFIGFLPASRPRIVVAAIIDEPRTIYGGVAAAPLFQQVARCAIQRLGSSPAPPVRAARRTRCRSHEPRPGRRV